MRSICCCKNGPSYLPVLNSCLTDFWNTLLNIEILSSLDGVNVVAMYLIAALKPYCKLVGMCLYLMYKSWVWSNVSHSLAWYGVLIGKFGLCESTGLGSMVIVSEAGAVVSGEVRVGVAGS